MPLTQLRPPAETRPPLTVPASDRGPVDFVFPGFAPDPVPYPCGLELQDQAAERVRSGADRGTVLLLEHPPVYTAGRRAAPEEFPRDGTPVIPVSRGGKVTWHGPGQLVVYPVVRLRAPHGPVDFVRRLERLLIDVAAEFGISGFRVPGRSGVWVEHGAAPAKIAQIGIHASRGIITHGLALNCSNDLTPFSGFVPCGITDAGVTTLSALAGREVSPREAAEHVVPHIAAVIEEVVA